MARNTARAPAITAAQASRRAIAIWRGCKPVLNPLTPQPSEPSASGIAMASPTLAACRHGNWAPLQGMVRSLSAPGATGVIRIAARQFFSIHLAPTGAGLRSALTLPSTAVRGKGRKGPVLVVAQHRGRPCVGVVGEAMISPCRRPLCRSASVWLGRLQPHPRYS
jgi:hypothetical protein